MLINVGIDVGKESLDLCVLLDKTIGKLKSKKFKNKKEGYISAVEWLTKTIDCAPGTIAYSGEREHPFWTIVNT